MVTAFYSSKKYREAITKVEQCKVPLEGYQGRKKEYDKYCSKSKSNNIILCPQKIINRKKDERVQWITDYFKNIGKKSKERTRKKGKERRKKIKKQKMKKLKKKKSMKKKSKKKKTKKKKSKKKKSKKKKSKKKKKKNSKKKKPKKKRMKKFNF